MDLNDHPTVKQIRAGKAGEDVCAKVLSTLQADWLKQLAMDCGADDAGMIDIGQAALNPQRAEILRHYPWTRTLLSFAVRMTREPVRSSARSVANLEFHHAGDRVDDVSHRIVQRLEETREPVLCRQNDAATGKIKWQGALAVAEIIEVAHQVKTFRLINPAGGDIPFQYLPGQFLTLDIEPQGIPTRRSYTIASTPTRRDHIEITVKREEHGLVSGWLHDALKPGDFLNLLAPNGTFVFTGSNAQSIVLIGGGVGMTPLKSVARYLTDSQWPGNVQLILSFRKPSDYLFREEVALLQARNPNLKVAVTLSNPGEEPWSGPVGRIDKAFLERVVPDFANQRVHLCGPPPMMDTVKAALSELGVAKANIKTDAFGTIKRDPTVAGAGAGLAAGRIQFQRSQVSATVLQGSTILDAADEADVYIDNACRSGTCGLCRVMLLSGKVRMAVEDSLTDDEKMDGYILACQAELASDVEIDA